MMNPLRTFAKTAPRSVTIFELKFFQPLSSYSVLMKERFHYLDRSPSDNNKSWSKNTPSRSTSLPRTKRTATLVQDSIFSSKFTDSISTATELHNYSTTTPTTLKPSSLTKMAILASSTRTRLNTNTRTPPANHVNKIPKGFFKITLRRSTIGMPKKLRAVVKALGLKRLSHTVYHDQTPIIAGMILKVKELLEVTNVKRVPTPEERKHHTEPGYVIIKRYCPTVPYE